MGSLIADQFRADPRVETAQGLILEALAEHQAQITGIRPPDPLHKKAYEALAGRAQDYRGAPLWFPYIGSGIGRGPFVELADGSVKLDLINGIGVHDGHGLPEVVGAMVAGAMGDLVMQGHLEQNREPIALTEELSKACGLPHCFLTTSGAMAVENGLKMAFQKQAPKRRLLAFRNAFHGRTCLLANITDRPQYREGLPEMVEVDYLPFYPEDALPVLKALLEKRPGEYAACLVEPIQGEGGVNVASRSFFLPLLDLLRKHKVSILVDEVQTFGRTSKPLAFQTLDLMEYADIVTIGKLAQVCATLFRPEYNPQPGLLSQTFTSSTAAIFAARIILGKVVAGCGRHGQIHHYLEQRLKRLEPAISGPYGMGLMAAFTLGKGDAESTQSFIRRLFHNGVITFMAGQNPTRVRLLLPPCIQEGELELAVSVIEQTLKEGD